MEGRIRHKLLGFLLGVLMSCSACEKDKAPVQDKPEEHIPEKYEPTPYEITLPENFPNIEIPADNPMTEEGVALGRKLYYDPILSNDGRSCSSCHLQEQGFALKGSVVLPHVNLAWNENFLWNGKVEGTLEDIMLFEVEEFFETDIEKLNNDTAYRRLFWQAYDIEEIASEEVAKALAQFLRTMISGNSKLDRYLRHEEQLTTAELNGYVIFNSEKGDCFHCHSIPLFTDNDFHNTGLDSTFSGENRGRYIITGDPNDKGKFKTPTLRNVALRPPYMHDGRFASLEEVVEFYSSGLKNSAYIDPLMKNVDDGGIQLTQSEKEDLVAFLKALTDTSYQTNKDFSDPE